MRRVIARLSGPASYALAVLCLCLQLPTTAIAQQPHTATQRTRLAFEIRTVLPAFPNDYLATLEHDTLHGEGLRQVRAFVRDPFSIDAPSYERLATVRGFLERMRPVADTAGGTKASPPPPPPAAGALGNLLGLPAQTRIIAGVADFFVARAKDELVLAYLNGLRTRLDATPVIDSLLPSSAQTLRLLDVLTPRALVPMMRASAVRDFAELPERATNLRVYPEGFLRLSRRDSTMAQGAHLALGLARELREGRPLAVAMTQLHDIQRRDLLDERLRVALITLGTVAGEYVATEGSVTRIETQPVLVPYLVAFLAADVAAAPGYEWAPGATSASLREFARAHQREYMAVVSTVNDAQARIAALRKDATALPLTSADGRLAALQLVSDLLHAAAPLVPGSATEIGAGREHVARVLRLFTTLEQGIADQDYSSIVAALTPVIVGRAEPGSMPSKAGTARRNTFRFVAFASSLVAAKDSEGITHVLEAVAAPVGSFRAKRVIEEDQGRWSFTLNGYVGIGGGAEWSAGRTERGRPAGQFGMSLPIGPELTVGGFGGRSYAALDPRRLVSGVRSLGLFLPLVDLGNVANFRLRADSLSDTPEVGFSQVFAPGAFLMAGISAWKPFSIGIGGQYAPSLRKSLDSDELSSVWRASVIFGFDIPVIRF